MWRLFDCRWQSRTVTVKIRYGDFFTETGRETFEKPVLSLNEFYDRILRLFYKKHQKGRGIRLLGAGLMNLETKKAYQADLFTAASDRAGKERRLEETILEINKKFPAAALKRARLV
jgi:DNA polymerase-4